MVQNKSYLPLSRNKLFSGIQSSVDEKFPQSNYVNFNEGDVIYQSGDTSQCIYLILSGEVKVKIPLTMGGPLVERKGKNEFFGEKELLENIPRRSSAVANTTCTLYKLMQKEVQKLISTYKRIGDNIAAGSLDTPENENADTDIPFKDTSNPAESSESNEIGTESPADNPADNNAFNIKDIDDQANDILLEEFPDEVKAAASPEPAETITPEENSIEEINFDLTEELPEETETTGIDDLPETHEILQEDTEVEIHENDDLLLEQNTGDEIENPEMTEQEIIPDRPEETIEADKENLTWEINKEDDPDIEQNKIDEEAAGLIDEKLKTDMTGETIEPEQDQLIIKEEDKDEIISNGNESLYLKTLRAVLQINKETEPDDIFNSITKVLKEYTKANLVRIYINEPEKNELYCISINEDKERRIKKDKGLTGWAAEKEETIILTDASSDSRYDADADGFDENNNILLFPVVDGNAGLVSLILLGKYEEEISADDQAFVKELSGYIAAAVEKGKQFDSIIKKSRMEYLNKVSGFIFEGVSTPVQIIKHYAEFIQKKTGVPDIVQISNFICEQTDIVTNSVALLSDFITDKNTLSLKEENLNDIINNILEMLAEYVEIRNVKLFKKLEADVKVSADQTALYFVCFQITKNACDAMPEGGNFYLSTSIEDNTVNIEFKDTGTGIPSIIKDRIFEPFFSFGKGKAAGLGLSVSEKIIKNHGGTISLGKTSSEGTAIFVSLPVMHE